MMGKPEQKSPEGKHTGRQPSIDGRAISDEAIDMVAGGFQIKDTCENIFKAEICFSPWWKMRCPNLQELSSKTHKGLGGGVYTKYRFSCSKGVFTDIEYVKDY